MARAKRISIESAEKELSSAKAEYMSLIRVPTPLLLRVIEEQLTETQKKYIVKYYYEGMTLAEIASEYSVEVSTVSRTIARARKRLIEAFRYYKSLK